MKEELKAGRIEIERTTDDYLKLKVNEKINEFVWHFLKLSMTNL